ncbi:Uncharacterised protein [Yersinia rohdei]|nr:Uncharacterised protein [Yersinia rohdei]
MRTTAVLAALTPELLSYGDIYVIYSLILYL